MKRMRERRSLELSADQSRVILKRLQKTPKAIVDKSGALLSVKPVAIGLGKSAELKVAVHYQALSHAMAYSLTHYPGYETRERLVSVEELIPRFKYDTRLSPNYALDLGQGLIPIFVFQFRKKDTLFLEMEEVNLAIRGTRGQTSFLKPYKIETGVIQFIGSQTGGKSSLENFWRIFKQYQKLRQRGLAVLPEALGMHSLVPVPNGVGFEELKSLIRPVPEVTLAESNIFHYMDGV